MGRNRPSQACRSVDSETAAPAQRRPRGLLGRLFDLFSSITLGIWLLSFLFLYSSIGSAGLIYPTSLGVFNKSNWTNVQVRQWRPFEMTEYEWFNWWPFVLLIGLICTNLVVATLRRIPLRKVNFGVWMIHTGIITLALGSVWYFNTKIEGDSPVVRRQVQIVLPTGERDSLPAVPGAQTAVGDWRFDVSEVNLNWTLASGPDKGQQTIAVTVRVMGPEQSFMRQLLDGYPQYTEDIIATGNPQQPMARAIKAIGTALVDESLALSLETSPQEHVYLANWVEKSWALYLRKQGDREWVQRPIDGLPFYNDYIGSREEVWLPDGMELPLDPLDISVPPAEAGDPLPNTDLNISAYLRYADIERRYLSGGTMLDPFVQVHVAAPGQPHISYDLHAFDREKRQDPNGVLQLVWANNEAEREAVTVRRDPVIEIGVAQTGESLVLPLPLEKAFEANLEFTPVAGTDYAYRIDFWRDNWEIEPGQVVSMAQVSVQTGEREFKRWVFAHPQEEQVDRVVEDHSTHDHQADPHGADPHSSDPHGGGAHGGGQVELDRGLDMKYVPGRRPAPITLVAGPREEQLSLILSTPTKETGLVPVTVGESIDLGDGVSIEIDRFSARGGWDTRPRIVAPERRDREVKERKSMVKLSTRDGDTASTWVRFHHYPVRSPGENLRRYLYHPSEMRMPDGTIIEVMLSRQRLPLPAPVVLDDFELITHVGGYTGSNLSVLNWRSLVSFAKGDSWTDSMPVAVNEPAEYGGYWYFQAQWDPPSPPRAAGDPASQGLNYTVLGVGNRNGVGIQLLGCCIAVLGMLYAFYYKPTLIRRMRKARAATTGGPGLVGDRG